MIPVVRGAFDFSRGGGAFVATAKSPVYECLLLNDLIKS